jgi:hypothetical protein
MKGLVACTLVITGVWLAIALYAAHELHRVATWTP